MKPNLKPITALLIATGAAGYSLTAAADPTLVRPAERAETSYAYVYSTADAAGGEARMAADGETKQEHRVEIMTNSNGSFVDLAPLESLGSLAELGTVFSSVSFDPSGRGVMMRSGKNVKNAPYSAEVISESVQTLADGNQISKRNSSFAYRDSAGSTRQEVRDSKGEVKNVHIHDVASGNNYSLSPGKKTAVKFPAPPAIKLDGAAIREKARAMAKDGKHTIIESGGPGQTVIIKRSEGPNGEKVEMREEVKVNVIKTGSSTTINGVNVDEIVNKALNEAAVSGPMGLSFRDHKWSSKATTTSLGTKDMEGVKVEGKSVAYTIPAGEMGNKNPITVTTESWYSPDLQVTVYTKHSDPRSGDSIYRLANIKRSEPAPALFTVPADYTVKDIDVHTSIVKDRREAGKEAGKESGKDSGK